MSDDLLARADAYDDNEAYDLVKDLAAALRAEQWASKRIAERRDSAEARAECAERMSNVWKGAFHSAQSDVDALRALLREAREYFPGKWGHGISERIDRALEGK